MILVGEAEREWPVGRLIRRWEDNIKMDLTHLAFDIFFAPTYSFVFHLLF
jgi:hypothetical protein